MDLKEEYGLIWTGYNLPVNLEIFVGDITSRGRDEVVAVHPTGSVFIFRYDNGIFKRISALNIGRRIAQAAIGDIDGDGQKELVIASGNQFIAYKWRSNRLDRLFVSPAVDDSITGLDIGKLTSSRQDEVAIAVGGKTVQVYRYEKVPKLIAEKKLRKVIDLKVGNALGRESDQIIVFEGSGTAGGDSISLLMIVKNSLAKVFEANVAARADQLLGVKNVTGGFKDEILLATSGGRRLMVLEVSGQTLARRWVSSGFSSSIDAVEAADWDNDGKNELFVAVGTRVFVYKYRGGTFTLIKTAELSSPVFSLAAGDVDREGNIEVVAASKAGLVIILKDHFEAKSQFLIQEHVRIPKRLPAAIKIAEVKVTRVVISRKDVISGRIIVSGRFLISVMYVAEPDRRVFLFEEQIPFTHFIPVPGLRAGDRVFVDVITEYVDFRFNPAKPRELEVIIVAQVVVFDVVIRKEQPLVDLAKEYNVSVHELAKVNKMSVSDTVEAGGKLKLPLT